MTSTTFQANFAPVASLSDEELDAKRKQRIAEREARYQRYMDDHKEFVGKHQFILEAEQQFDVVFQNQERTLHWFAEISASGLRTLELAGLFADFVKDRKGHFENQGFIPSTVLNQPCFIIGCTVGHLNVTFHQTLDTVTVMIDTVKSVTDMAYTHDHDQE